MDQETPDHTVSDSRVLAGADVVTDSHRRCESFRLDRALPGPKNAMAVQQLTSRLNHYEPLITFSHLLFSAIHRDVSDGQQVFVLTDPDGWILDVVSDPSAVVQCATGLGVRVGVSLHERSGGTNATALVLRGRRDCAVVGDQHFLQIFHSCCSVGVPILDMDGELRGSVGIWACGATQLSEKLVVAKYLAKDLGRFIGQVGLERAGFPVEIPTAAGGVSSSREEPTTPRLTDRQHEVLKLYANGLSYKEIARELGVQSTKTIQAHLNAIRDKLGASNHRESIQRASACGVL